MRSKNYRQGKTENRKKKILQQHESEGLQKLVREADAILSTYVRKIFRLDTGLVPCYTCGTHLKFQEIECGHFVPRGEWATRWLVDNCRPQCPHCNGHLKGNLTVFRARLEAENPGLPDYLERLAHDVFKPTRGDLKDIITMLKEKMKNLK